MESDDRGLLFIQKSSLKVIFEQRPKRRKGLNHVDIKQCRHQADKKSMCKGPEVGAKHV